MLKSHRGPTRSSLREASGSPVAPRTEPPVRSWRPPQGHGPEPLNPGAWPSDREVGTGPTGAAEVPVTRRPDVRRTREVTRRVRMVRKCAAHASFHVVFDGRLGVGEDPGARAELVEELTGDGHDAVFVCAADLNEFSDFLCGPRTRRRPPAAQRDPSSVPHRSASIGEVTCPL